VLVFCNYGPDLQNATKAAVDLGLNKKMTFGGILCGNEVAIGMPVDDIVGSLWGYIWGPEAGGSDAAALYTKLKAVAQGFPQNWRQYLGYISGQQLTDRIQAAGTTDTSAIIKAFEGHHYNAYKKQPAYWRACDHQAVQEAYAGEIVSKNKRRSPQEFFAIASAVGGEYAAESCSNSDSEAATKIFNSQTIPARSDYTVQKV